jgi:hypothetical protein
VRNEAAFKKFLMNLWDLDVKTAPPPQAALQAQVPERMRSKLKSLKLAANEKIIFGLTDGFLRYESGHVYLGETLDAERLARGDLPAIDAKGPTVALQIDGESQAPEQKRKAFEKSREHLLSLPKQSADESAAGFALKKAFLDYQLAKLEVLFAEASQVQAGWTISRDKKVAELHVEAAAQNDTSLAKDIERLGQSLQHVHGDRVHDFLVVEFQDRHRSIEIQGDVLELHGFLARWPLACLHCGPD